MAASGGAAGRWPKMVLFGDSITQQSFRPGGWGASLADRYARKADVVVRGYGGYNTRTSERQHVPVDEYRENLKKIVHHLKDCSGSMLILLITPPPVDEDGRERYARSLYGDKARELPERTNEVTGLYAKQCIEIAKELHVPCIDLWSRMQETKGWQEFYLSDGLHLTAEGNAVVYREVVRELESAGLRAEAMPYDFPHHSVIDGDHPERAFHVADKSLTCPPHSEL